MRVALSHTIVLLAVVIAVVESVVTPKNLCWRSSRSSELLYEPAIDALAGNFEKIKSSMCGNSTCRAAAQCPET
eukprot:IDg7418t1